MPEAYASFPGLAIRSADMIFSTGVTPSSCHVVAVPDAVQAQVGTLALSDGDTTITFPDCAIDYSYSTPQMVRKGTRVHLRILDRRWRWENVPVTGWFNRRWADSVIDPDSKKTYNELFELLLDELGETDYVIEPSFTMDAPEVNWDASPANLELNALAEKVGCRVVLQLDNKVRIVSNSSGGLFPANGRERHEQYDQAPSHIPATIRVEFGPTVYQNHLGLEPVGLELDGSLQPIRELSYSKDGPLGAGITPDWREEDPGVFIRTVGTGQLHARMSIWKTFRVRTNTGRFRSQTHSNDPFDYGPPFDYERVLPLLPSISIIAPGQGNTEVLGRPQISGRHAAGGLFGGSSPVGWWLVETPHRINFDTGVVEFDSPVFANTTDATRHIGDPTLFLYVQYHQRPDRYADPDRVTYDLNTGLNVDADAGTVVIKQHDMFRFKELESLFHFVRDNQSELLAHAQDLAQAYLDNLKVTPMASMEWDGVVDHSPTGNLPQMRWIVGDSVMTYGYKNTYGPNAPSEREMRLREEMRRRSNA